jgi:predicted metal-dependent hydrolase
MPNPTSSCDSPLPPLALEAIRLFNAGEYHAQHDLFEEVWRSEPLSVREGFLIHAAVAQKSIIIRVKV